MLLPEVRKHVRIVSEPVGRRIAGRSSGGIGAFTVTWQRPDAFRKVFSAKGSFVNIRGGGVYPELVKKTNNKPLRVSLQDGVNTHQELASHVV